MAGGMFSGYAERGKKSHKPPLKTSKKKAIHGDKAAIKKLLLKRRMANQSNIDKAIARKMTAAEGLREFEHEGKYVPEEHAKGRATRREMKKRVTGFVAKKAPKAFKVAKAVKPLTSSGSAAGAVLRVVTQPTTVHAGTAKEAKERGYLKKGLPAGSLSPQLRAVRRRKKLEEGRNKKSKLPQKSVVGVGSGGVKKRSSK